MKDAESSWGEPERVADNLHLGCPHRHARSYSFIRTTIATLAWSKLHSQTISYAWAIMPSSYETRWVWRSCDKAAWLRVTGSRIYTGFRYQDQIFCAPRKNRHENIRRLTVVQKVSCCACCQRIQIESSSLSLFHANPTVWHVGVDIVKYWMHSLNWMRKPSFDIYGKWSVQTSIDS